MKHIYISLDDEDLILYDDEEDLFELFRKRGTSLTKEQGDQIREGRREPSIRSLRERSELPNGGRKCSRCGVMGHRADRACPINPMSALKPQRTFKRRSKIPSPEDADAAVKKATSLSEDDLRASVSALYTEGKNSAEISKSLRIPLSKVNEYWPRSTANEDEPIGLETI